MAEPLDLSIDQADPFKGIEYESQPLSTGGFGRVHRYKRTTGGPFIIAVKSVDIPLKEPDRTQRLMTIDREEKVTKKLMTLPDHPHIVKYIGCHRTKYVLSMFMEYLDGGDIEGLIFYKQAQSHETVLEFMRQIASGLSYLHSLNIFHYDLKSGNILLDDEENPKVYKICDYGFSKNFCTEGDNSTSYGFRGPSPFMAPEVADGYFQECKEAEEKLGYNGKCDVWSLGAIGLHLATGEHPWTDAGDVMKHLGEYALTLPQDDHLIRVLKRVLVISQEERCDLDTAQKLIAG